MRFGTECQVAGDEPHDVVTADALVGFAAFVHAVGLEETLLEMPEGHAADVLDDNRLHVGKRQLRDHATAALDLAGDRQPVPERARDAALDQVALLRGVRQPRAGEQRGVGVEQVATPFPEYRRPVVDGDAPPLRARRHVGAVGIEPAVQPLPVDDVLRCVVSVGEQFSLRERQLPVGHRCAPVIFRNGN